MDVPRRGSPLIYRRSPSSVGMVALVDENTGSDAELAAHAFQKLGITDLSLASGPGEGC